MPIDLRAYHASRIDDRDAYVHVYENILKGLCPKCIPIEDVRFWADDPAEMYANFTVEQNLSDAVFASFDKSGKCSVGFELLFTDRQRLFSDRRYIIRLAVTFDANKRTHVQVDGNGDYTGSDSVVDAICDTAKRLIEENTKT